MDLVGGGVGAHSARKEARGPIAAGEVADLDGQRRQHFAPLSTVEKKSTAVKRGPRRERNAELLGDDASVDADAAGEPG